MAKHLAPSTVSLGQRILMVVVALLVVAAGFGTYTLLSGGGGDAAADSDEAGDGDPTVDASLGDPGCGRVTVWADLELTAVVQAAADRAKSDCFTYSVVSRGPANALSALERDELPDAWIPGSLAWPTQAQNAGTRLQIGEILASSPVMLAGTPEGIATLGELGVSPDSTWPELLSTYSELAGSGELEVGLRVGDPRQDAASMSLLGAATTEAGGVDDSGSPVRRLMTVLAQTAVQGDVANAVAADPGTLVPLTEHQMARAAENGLELQGLPLDAGVVRVPFVRGREAVSPGAIDALEQQLLSEEGQSALAELGLRPGTDGPAPEVTGVPDELGTDGADQPAESVAALSEVWSVIAPRSRMLALMDISGSMEAPIGDTTRIDLTREAAQAALAVVPGRTEVGMWFFATSLDGDKDYREVVSLRPLDEEVRGVTQRDLMTSETSKLGVDILEGDTGLHDSLWAAYDHMLSTAEPDSISSVLLLTDGINDDSTGGLSEDEIIDKLVEARGQGGAPVTVVLIGVGPDVDESALKLLALAAGGESLVIRDPRELPQVFVDVVASRSQ